MWCGVKITFGMSPHSKECTFPTFVKLFTPKQLSGKNYSSNTENSETDNNVDQQLDNNWRDRTSKWELLHEKLRCSALTKLFFQKKSTLLQS
jgi:hypothetical protein